jgi:hypothetical protein
MIVVSNAFSLNMIAETPATIDVRSISLDQAQAILAGGDFQSAVGHADTALLFQDALGVRVPMDRRTISLRPGDTLLVGQYVGPRLPEGTTRLPEGATIRWLLVRVAASH